MRMKNFRLILLSCVIAISLLFSGTAYAQDEELQLPSPGITPDSPFYFVDIWGKRIGLFLAFGPEAKARKALEYAEDRLAEAQAMAVKNKSKAVGVATGGYDDYVTIAIEKMNEAKNKGVDISEVSEIAALATSNHLLVWDGVMGIVPEDAREAVIKAKRVSINGLGNALRLLAGENPGKAMKINLSAMEGRLNKAKDEADKNNPDGAGDGIGDFVELIGFGKEISGIAQGLGKDTTALQTLIDKATSHHLVALALVSAKLAELENVPDKAKAAILKAIEVSERGHTEATGAIDAGLPDDARPLDDAGLPDDEGGKMNKAQERGRP